MVEDNARRLSQEIVSDLFGPPAERGFRVEYWDGAADTPGLGTQPGFTLVLRRPCALRRMLTPPTERALGEAYVRGDIDIEGDLEAATSLRHSIRSNLGSPRRLVRILARLRSLPADSDRDAPSLGNGFRPGRWSGRHSRPRDAEAVRFHYDAGNDFFGMFLDRRMMYSCAYFRSPADDLDVAQEAKLEHICRKLNLQPGERLLDIGCGWGGLVEFAASRFGVEAVGITLSQRQADLARQRIAASGLGERCHIRVDDYRALPADLRFDKVVSVGMVEHVGRARLRRYFAEAFRRLEPGGLFLNHGIVSIEAPGPAGWLIPRTLRRWTSFTEHHVFPDSELVKPVEMIGPAEDAGFEVRDVENLREHYVLTLRHWMRRLEERRSDAVACAGERIWRVWRLYMAGSAHAFATGGIGVIQVLLAKRRADGSVALPHTREHVYALDPAAPDARRGAAAHGWRPAHAGGNGDAAAN